jgi:hypothetical protein
LTLRADMIDSFRSIRVNHRAEIGLGMNRKIDFEAVRGDRAYSIPW